MEVDFEADRIVVDRSGIDFDVVVDRTAVVTEQVEEHSLDDSSKLAMGRRELVVEDHVEEDATLEVVHDAAVHSASEAVGSPPEEGHAVDEAALEVLCKVHGSADGWEVHCNLGEVLEEGHIAAVDVGRAQVGNHLDLLGHRLSGARRRANVETEVEGHNYTAAVVDDSEEVLAVVEEEESCIAADQPYSIFVMLDQQ